MRTTRSKSGLTAAALAALLLGTACSSDDAATTSDPGVVAGAAESSDAFLSDEAAPQAAPGDLDEAVARAAGGGTTLQTSASAIEGRALARTARLELRVADIDQSAARIRALVSRLGGFIADAEVRGGEDGYGVLTLRLPANQLDAAVGELGELADEVVLQQIGTEDLTDQLSDTSTRIANLEALEAELRALMVDIRERTSSAQELLIVFNQVNDVRLQIEQLEARRAGITDRVALATVTVDLQPVGAPPVEITEPPSTVSEAWATTRSAFGDIGDAMVWLAVTVVPVGLALLLPLALVAYALRQIGRGAIGRRAESRANVAG